MKTTNYSIPAAILIISSIFLLTNCTNNDDITKDTTIPVLTTMEVTEITPTTATSGGVISSDGGATVTARGVCWSTSPLPTIADKKANDSGGVSNFTSSITGLTANTSYYVRAYATNDKGTGYGSAILFKTGAEINTNGDIEFNPNISYGNMTDIEGNNYKTVTIGTQTWMAENLKVTKYLDGTSIPNITEATAWSATSTGAFCNFNNDERHVATYGRLYNWYAINTSKLCPAGWHVPNEAEWTTLISYLGGENVAGAKLRETGASHWKSPNDGATNETGFTGVPAGMRDGGGSFYAMKDNAFWWSTTEYSTNVWYWYMDYTNSSIHKAPMNKKLGFSIRCVKN